ncbi:uncharacterized protein [Lepeophtheirus salmonis]|nr:zinc finger protein 2 homolog [Lepeophtheirus salmonis]
MGVSCPLCLNTEAFTSLHNLYNALTGIYICPICKVKPSGSLVEHLLTVHLTNAPSPPSPSIPDPLDELLKDFSDFVQDEAEDKVIVKVEEGGGSKNKTGQRNDINFEVFQTTLTENSNEITNISPPTSAILAAVSSSPSARSKSSSSSNNSSPLNKSVQCNICGWNFDNNNFLQLHMVLMHSGRQAISSSNYTANSNLPKEYKCRFCTNVSFDTFNDYVHHVQDVHNDYRYICHICSRMFKLRGSLLVHHRVVHTTARVVQSHLLNESRTESVTPSNTATVTTGTAAAATGSLPSSQEEETCLKEEEEHSKGSPKGPDENNTKSNFQCPQCNKTFKREYHLNQHIKVHENRFWDCEVCLKSFTTKYFLKKHMRLHTGETPYTCGICGKSFTFQQSYHKHMLYHTDEKPYHCSQCGRAFKELSTLQNHERIHSGERPFACETCGKSFRQRVSYLVHRRIHTGVMPYSCEACGKNFRYKVTQRTHKCPNVGTSSATSTPNKTVFPVLPNSIKNDLQKFRQQVQDRRRHDLATTPPFIGGEMQKLTISVEEDEEKNEELNSMETRIGPNLPPIPLNLEDILKDVCLFS